MFTIAFIGPIILSALVMLLGLLVKAVLNSESFRPANPARGHELFRIFFLGPDLGLLALSLLISSQALREVLNGYKINTNFGESFGMYFWMSVVTVLVLLILSVVCWLTRDNDERRLITEQDSENRQNRTGDTYQVTVWKVQWGKSLVGKPGMSILIIGNLFGIAAVLTYAIFMFKGFLEKP
jgi:cytochrome bd-type quinol oxidase subunit 2